MRRDRDTRANGFIVVQLLTAGLLAACGVPPPEAPGAVVAASPAAATPHAAAAGAPITPAELMDWAEATFPQAFPAGASDRQLAPFVYRSYLASGNHLGVDDNGMVWVLGAISAGELRAVGTLDEFACLAVMARCVAPSIVVPPRDQSVDVGTPVNFTATLAGGPSLRYQWLRNGEPIAGATGSSHERLAALADDGARFALQVENAKGRVTSAAAVLTVTADPAAAARALADQRGCFACHTTSSSTIATGPGFGAIGARYAAVPGAAALLVGRVRGGTTGSWGPFSMPAQAVSLREAEILVGWILTLR